MSYLNIDYKDIQNSFKNVTNTGRICFSFLNENNTKYYFKANGKFNFDYNEILSSILAKAVGVQSVSPVSCVYKHSDEKYYQGVLTKDYTIGLEEAEVINFYDLLYAYDINATTSVEVIMNAINYFVYKLKEENIKLNVDSNLENDLKKLSLFLYITGQQDLNIKNIEFIKHKNSDGTYTIKLAPFVDNSLTFFQKRKYGIDMKYVEENTKSEIAKLDFFLMIKDDNYDQYSHSRIVRELSLEILQNKELAEMFKKVYLTNFEKEIETYCKDNPNNILQPHQIKKAITYFNTSLQMLSDFVKKIDHVFISNIEDKKSSTTKQNLTDNQTFDY